MSSRPTLEEIQRVREFECTYRGHSFSVMVNGSGVPRVIICNNCGIKFGVGERIGSDNSNEV